MASLAVKQWQGFALGCLVTAALVLALRGWAAPAVQPATRVSELLDRAQIEDLLVDYYGHLGPGGGDFGAFYVEDGVLDVNGIVAQGRKPIEQLYARVAQGTPRLPGTFRMLLTNPRIAVHGDHATADVIWTGINSPAVTAPPRFVEQGREHDELVKRGGRWYFQHRVITSDGGMPAMFEKTYRRR